LDALGTAPVEEGRGLLVVIDLERHVRERSEILTQSPILLFRRDAGQQFLPDGTDDRGSTFSDQRC
jgi:hypothetical protein